MLLERRFSDAALREHLVAAYVIGWSITADDMSTYPALAQLGICSSKAQTGCVVTYNTQQNPGDFSQTSPSPTGIVQANAYSVNPLTWVASNPNEMEPTAAAAAENLGALFYEFQPPVKPQLGPAPGSPVARPGRAQLGKLFHWWRRCLRRSDRRLHRRAKQSWRFSGRLNCVAGARKLPEPELRPTMLLPGWYHNYDYSFFFFNLEQNVIDRIASYNASR